MTGDPHAEIRRLRSELVRLREENEYLRCFLEVDSSEEFVDALIRTFGITHQHAVFIEILHKARGRVVNRELIMAALPGRERSRDARYKLDHVIVCKIRSIIGEGKIVTAWGVGYSISREFMSELDELIASERAQKQAQRPAGEVKPVWSSRATLLRQKRLTDDLQGQSVAE